MIYLDYNATTPLAPEAREAMLPFLNGEFGNPSSIHSAGRRSRAAIDDSRDQLAALLGVRSHELIFTGGGTEACNLGVIGLARAHSVRGKHLITSGIEHHAVLHAMEYLQHFEGFDVTFLPVSPQGIVCPADLANALRPDTILTSIMHANNETGALQPIAELAALCRSKNVLFHTDAVQTFGKIPVHPADLGVSALSLTAHKFYGPKGVGALWLDAGTAISRIGHGGAHENTRRPGTENVAAIAGLAAAAELAVASSEAVDHGIRILREQLWSGIKTLVPHAVRNSEPRQTLSNTLNVSFPGADGESLLIGLDLEGICVSSGSACMVGSIQPSHVLLAMGVAPATAMSTVRFSLGKATTSEEIATTIQAVGRVVDRQAAHVQ